MENNNCLFKLSSVLDSNYINLKFEIKIKDKIYNYFQLISIFNENNHYKKYDLKRSDFPKFFKVANNSFIQISEEDGQMRIVLEKYLVLKNIAKRNGFIIEEDPSIESEISILSQTFVSTEKKFACPDKINLRDYQTNGINWLNFITEKFNGGILADDMGLGKTLMSLIYIFNKLKTKKNLKFLVIAPASVVYNWESEIKKFINHIPHLIFTGENKDLYFLNTDAVNILISSYNSIASSLNEISRISFDTIFCDEAQRLKNYRSITHKSVAGLDSKNKILLSGTPMENNIIELWSLFDISNKGALPDLKVFRKSYKDIDMLDKTGFAVEELKNKINHLVLRREKKNVLKELPDKLIQEKFSELSDIQIELTKEIFNNTSDPHIVKFNKLTQLVSHPTVINKRQDNTIDISGKLRNLIDLLSLEEIKSSNTIIFTRFKATQRLIEKYSKNFFMNIYTINGSVNKESREEIILNTKKNKNPSLLILSYQAAAVGLNLQHFDIVFHYDRWWNPQLERQAEDRAYRMGRKGDVRVFSLITKNSIDEHILNLHQRKEVISKNILSDIEEDGRNSESIKEMVENFENEFRIKYN